METKRGGKRLGAGRKPLGLKKKPITLYVETNSILKFGSEEKTRNILYEFIKSYEEHDEAKWEGKLLEGESEPYKNFGTFIPSNHKEEPKPTIITQFQSYMKELNECGTYDEVVKIMSFVDGDSSLVRSEKNTLKIVSETIIEEKGFYNE